jgi:hypothetical protein
MLDAENTKIAKTWSFPTAMNGNIIDCCCTLNILTVLADVALGNSSISPTLAWVS